MGLGVNRVRMKYGRELYYHNSQVICTYNPASVDRIWLWVYYSKSPIYLIFYLLKGDYTILNYKRQPYVHPPKKPRGTLG